MDELLAALERERERDHGLACWLLELLGDSRSPRTVPLFASLLGDADASYRFWQRPGCRDRYQGGAHGVSESGDFPQFVLVSTWSHMDYVQERPVE